MYDTVRAEAAPQHVDLTRDECVAHVVPAALIGEFQEHVVGGILGAKDPEGYHDHEEAQDVSDQARCLKLRKEGRAPSVEDDCNEYDGPHQESDLPPRELVVGLANVDAGLDLPGNGVTATCKPRDPTESRHPTGRI